jgi:tetratricopeptide (TPR) repeat protein
MDDSASAAGGLLSRRQLGPEQQEKKERLLGAGHEAFDEEQYARALDCYHRASLLDAADSDVWTALGMAYANLDLHREAWRSYKLALICDPDNVDALWYAAEFLFNMEDFLLAKAILERYIPLEAEVQRRAEADELLSEVLRQIGDDDDIRDRPRYAGAEDLLELDEDDDDPLDGFEIDDEPQRPRDDYAEELAQLSGRDPDEDQDFIASLHLELTGMQAKCGKCSTPLPLDAPYCYNCLAPHIYE